MQDFFADLRFGLRMLWKSPTFTLVAVLTLALCVGANTAIFTLVNAILLRPLPYKDSNRLVWVTEILPRPKFEEALGPDYVGWKSQARSFEQIAAYDSDSFNVSGVGEPLRVEAGEVTSTFFPLFELQPSIGRPFSQQEDKPGAEGVTLLTNSFWQSHFGAQADAIGKSLLLNGAPYRIVGVLPRDFKFPDTDMKPDLLLPLPLSPYNSADKGIRSVSVVGRLTPATSMKQATAELDAINQQAHGTAKKDSWLDGIYAQVTPLQEHMVGASRRSLLVLLVAVGFVLLIGCGNIANLQLARSTARQREVAVRTALGASRVRLVRQFLTESVLLSAMGGSAGLFLATWLVNALSKVQIEALPHLNQLRVDSSVFAFTLLLIVVTSIGFGLAPAVFSTRPDVGRGLHSGGPRLTLAAQQRRFSGMLVISEIALAMVLLAGAGLLIRTFAGLLRTDPGFEPAGVLSARISLPESAYSTRQLQTQFFQQLLQRLQGLPGVTAAAVGSSLPLADHAMHGVVRAEGQTEGLQGLAASIFIDGVSADYFRVLGIPLLGGRIFTAQDTDSSSTLAILNHAAAIKLFPGQDALGKHVRMGRGKDWLEVVGVVGDVRDSGMDAEDSPQMYLPLAQVSSVTKIAIRTGGDPGTLAGALRQEVQALDGNQPVYDVLTMEARIADSLVPRKFNMLLLAAFAALALILAGVGIYGVISYTVAQRTHEIGIRVALGADRLRILRLVVGNGMLLGTIGVGCGLAGALALLRYMSGLLYGIRTSDAITMISVSALLLGTALLASYVPARRAANVDPVIALRYE